MERRMTVTMNLAINENGCMDDEVKVLDTRLPYFYAHVCNLFTKEPSEVNVVLVHSKDEFVAVGGKPTSEGAFSKGNTIYILEPSLFGTATNIQREHFYRTLYQELVYLFYQSNKKNN